MSQEAANYELDGHSIHHCIDTGNGVKFDPPLPLSLTDIKIHDGESFVEADMALSVAEVFTPGAVLAVPKSRKP